MSNLLLEFRLRLESAPVRSGALYISGVYGPQFHRWLPNGETDAITLPTGDPSAALKVWFERRGYVDGRLIKFDYKRQEVAPAIMVQQGKLDAGPLIGLLEIRGLSQEDATSLQEKRAGDSRYSALEKRVIKLFYPPVQTFLSMLRTRYGQYWIPEVETWDSRNESASAYLRRFGFPHWSLDEGKTWNTFCSGSIRLTVGALRKRQDFREYLTEEEWRETANLLQQEWEPSPAASAIVEAVELFDRGYVRHAVIDAVTALELALGESFRQRLASVCESTFTIEELPFDVQVAIAMSMEDGTGEASGCTSERIRSTFFGLKLPKRFGVMATVLNMPEHDRTHTLKVIAVRNEIVHQGKSPPENIRSKFSGLLSAFALLLPEQKLRFPIAGPGNRTLTPEDWERVYREDKNGAAQPLAGVP